MCISNFEVNWFKQKGGCRNPAHWQTLKGRLSGGRPFSLQPFLCKILSPWNGHRHLWIKESNYKKTYIDFTIETFVSQKIKGKAWCCLFFQAYRRVIYSGLYEQVPGWLALKTLDVVTISCNKNLVYQTLHQPKT